MANANTDRVPLILVVDDEDAFIQGLRSGLTREGFAVDVARDGQEALERFARSEPDLVLLDVMLPKLSGIDVCRRLRETSTVPIIMVSAKGEEIDMVVGLEIGADDYVRKPYKVRELVARIRAQLRRASLSPPSTESSDATHVGTLSEHGVLVDVDRHEVMVDGLPQSLPLKEFELLRFLVANAGQVVSRDQIIDEVWGEDYVGDTKTLDVHIKRLRSKVERDPSEPVRIVTIRGLGYKFTATSR